MKKEIIIAIVLGILVGMGVAAFIISRTIYFSANKSQSVVANPSISPPPQTDLSQIKVLDIKEPANQTIVAKNSIKVKGKAGKDDLVVIQSKEQEKIFKNKNEEFSIDFPLALGENIILITVYPKNSQFSPQQKSVTIYYLDEL